MTGLAWTVETVAAVDAEIAALPVELRARLLRLLETVEHVGLETLRAPMSGISTASSGSCGFGVNRASPGGST